MHRAFAQFHKKTRGMMENNTGENSKKKRAITIERPFRHSVDAQLRFNDFDMLGHLNNTAYFALFDIGKSDYFNTIRGNKNHWNRVDIVIASVNCDFISPVYYTESISIKTQITHIHNKSFELLQAIVNKATGEIKAMCHTVMVGFDPDRGTSAPLSQQWKDAINRYEGFEQ